MRDLSQWEKWLSNETPLKSVTWREGCYMGGDGGGKKQDKKRTSEKVIRVSNRYKAAKSAQQLQLV